MALNRSLFKDEAGRVTGAGATENGQDVDDLRLSSSSNSLSQMQAQMAACVTKCAAGFDASSSSWEQSSPIRTTAHQWPPRLPTPAMEVPSCSEPCAPQWPSTPPRVSTSRRQPAAPSPAESELTQPEDGSLEITWKALKDLYKCGKSSVTRDTATNVCVLPIQVREKLGNTMSM